MKSNSLLRAVCLVALLAFLLPASAVGALVPTSPPPVDMFQLPWDQGIAWVAIDGIDNGTKRPTSSSHNYTLGGAIDFAPHNNMVTGENTSNFWVTAAAAGTVVERSSCDVTIAHAGGWVSQYQFLGNIQVKLGDVVTRNQRLAVIADGIRLKYCPGYQEINVPHLHFTLRPSLIGATLAGWQISYVPLLNLTRFTKNGTTLGLYKPLLNVMDTVPTPTMTSTPTVIVSPTPTIAGPYVSTTINPHSINLGATASVTVGLNNVPAAGYTSAEFTCSYNANSLEVSNITVGSLFGTDAVSAINGPTATSFIVAIAGSNGNKATTSGPAFTFTVKGLQIGQTVIDCRARVSQGTNTLTDIAYAVDYLTVLGSTPTPNLTPSATPTVGQPPVASATASPTPTGVPGNWLSFINTKYGFQFRYPPGSQLLAGMTDTYARINLPFVQGTNLSEKYLEVIVAENANPCRSPLATSSILETSQTVVINGLTFLKETGQDGSAGHINKWTAYSTSRNGVCVSLDFVLRAANPGVFSTPPPLYDEAAESAVFGQIVATYGWFDLPTATPTGSPSATFTPSPTGSATSTATSTPVLSPTPPGGNAVLTGQVIASKPVTIKIYDGNAVLVATVQAASDGTFNQLVPPGSYNVVASAPGFLPAQRTESVIAGITRFMPTVTLLAGDIDGNNVIDPLDALTIGMNYNASSPAAADLNNDGIINVLDLEQLAKNYRKTGPSVW